MDYQKYENCKIIVSADNNKKIPENSKIKVICGEESKQLTELYRTYEFTDNITLVTDESVPYPTIFNFLVSGILTEKEAWQALTI